MKNQLTLIIGNKRYSSWSLRPWLLLTQFEIPFHEILIPLDQTTTLDSILKYSKSGKVPALIDGDITVWESLAIAEYLNEKYPEKQMWPKNLADRALARSISNEMHAGFSTLRTHMPHDIQKNLTAFETDPALKDIQRIFEIWTDCLHKSSGPFLFKDFSIADAMYAPVVNRLISYGVSVPEHLKPYIDVVRNLKSHQQWIKAGLEEKLIMARYK